EVDPRHAGPALQRRGGTWEPQGVAAQRGRHGEQLDEAEARRRERGGRRSREVDVDRGERAVAVVARVEARPRVVEDDARGEARAARGGTVGARRDLEGRGRVEDD